MMLCTKIRRMSISMCISLKLCTTRAVVANISKKSYVRTEKSFASCTVNMGWLRLVGCLKI